MHKGNLVLTLALPFIDCVALGKIFECSKIQSPLYKMEFSSRVSCAKISTEMCLLAVSQH